MAARCVSSRLWRLTRTHQTVTSSLWTGRVIHTPDKVTHTGQCWEDDDLRNARFINRQKQVNESFAINLLGEEPVSVVKGTHVWCDGGDEALGHPKIYINLDKPEIQDCGYCGKKFVSDSFADQIEGNKIAHKVE